MSQGLSHPYVIQVRHSCHRACPTPCHTPGPLFGLALRAGGRLGVNMLLLLLLLPLDHCYCCYCYCSATAPAAAPAAAAPAATPAAAAAAATPTYCCCYCCYSCLYYCYSYLLLLLRLLLLLLLLPPPQTYAVRHARIDMEFIAQVFEHSKSRLRSNSSAMAHPLEEEEDLSSGYKQGVSAKHNFRCGGVWRA